MSQQRQAWNTITTTSGCDGGPAQAWPRRERRRQLFIIIDPTTGEEMSVYLDREEVKRMVGNGTMVSGLHSCDGDQQSELFEQNYTLSKGADLSSC